MEKTRSPGRRGEYILYSSTSVWNLHHVIIRSPQIWRWLIYFWKIFASLDSIIRVGENTVASSPWRVYFVQQHLSMELSLSLFGRLKSGGGSYIFASLQKCGSWLMIHQSFCKHVMGVTPYEIISQITKARYSKPTPCSKQYTYFHCSYNSLAEI